MIRIFNVTVSKDGTRHTMQALGLSSADVACEMIDTFGVCSLVVRAA